ncbi:MAG TPA: AbrB/MazE/SpoVT family DNA-binding domain-containing protein [Burkholderiaceae bacterium]|jgi:antitoxin MazE|nr:AbrB/MazE/SpoVT family DNA-binding domain-containing protein [Burkholderiaceae bacterium]
MKAELTVKKWGNNLGVRIPAEVAASVRLKVDQRVKVSARGGSIVIEPVRRRRFDLDQLVRAINKRNRHAAVDFGPAVGKEAF